MGAVAAAPVASAPIAPAAPVQQKQQPLPQRKSRAIPIVAPPEAAGAAEATAAAPEPAAPAVEGAAAAAVAPAAPAVDRNLVVNLDSSDSDEGHFSDHDLADENERTRGNCTDHTYYLLGFHARKKTIQPTILCTLPNHY